MTFSASITKRVRNRVLTDGTKLKQTRHVLQFNDPRTGKRRQLFFENKADAIAKRDELAVGFAIGAPALDHNKLTIGHAVEHWLENRRGEVKASTWHIYKLVATKHLIADLGHVRAAELTTAQIRRWHQDVQARVSAYTANVAKKYLGASLALAAEDFNVRVAPMPSRLGRGRPKPKKAILTPEQVRKVLDAAKADREHGLYYAFPFLTGVRPSEQLGLLWDKVDFEAGVVRIAAMLERDGTRCETTKTVAGLRDIPMPPLLRTLLLEWREVCPRKGGQLVFVFPGPNGGPFRYFNFRSRVWVPGLRRAGVPAVTPHSARHVFISTLQSRGFELGLVAKLAGHTPAVALSHYTQAVRGGDAAMLALEEAYSSRPDVGPG